MNLLIISQYYGLINGASICTYELIVRWSSLVDRIDVVCSQKHYKPENILQFNNVYLHTLSNFTPFKVRAKCQSLISENTVIYGADDYGIYGIIKGIPYVLTYHGNWPQALGISPKYFINGIFHTLMYILNFKFADAIVCPNYFHIPWISRFTSKAIMIRNGIRLESSNIHPSLNCPSIITVGRMDERKGKLLVDIIHELVYLSDQIPWYLYVVGPILYEPLKKLVDNNRILNIDFVPNVADYVREADIFVLASYMDLVSLAVTEAMALSKPVICFDVGALHEVVSNETGYLIPPFDQKNFAESILFLLQDKEQRYAKGKKAKEAVQDFDWDISASQYLGLFQKLLDNKN
jgi:glycosyltransferase involved in cell wall biosynthesis